MGVAKDRTTTQIESRLLFMLPIFRKLVTEANKRGGARVMFPFSHNHTHTWKIAFLCRCRGKLYQSINTAIGQGRSTLNGGKRNMLLRIDAFVCFDSCIHFSI